MDPEDTDHLVSQMEEEGLSSNRRGPQHCWETALAAQFFFSSLVSAVLGIEPWVPPMLDRCSATELRPHTLHTTLDHPSLLHEASATLLEMSSHGSHRSLKKDVLYMGLRPSDLTSSFMWL